MISEVKMFNQINCTTTTRRAKAITAKERRMQLDEESSCQPEVAGALSSISAPQLRKAIRSKRMAKKFYLLTLMVAAMITFSGRPAEGWRIYDNPTTLDNRQAYDSLLQPSMPSIYGNLNNHQYAGSVHHLLAPMSSQNSRSSPFGNQQQNSAATHYTSNGELSPFGSSMGLAQPAASFDSPPNNQQGDGGNRLASREETPQPPVAAALVAARSVEPPSSTNQQVAPANLPQQQQQQQSTSTGGQLAMQNANGDKSSLVSPSPAGKILNSALQAAVSAINSSSSSTLAAAASQAAKSDNGNSTATSASEKLLNQMLLKPRKQPADGSAPKSSLASNIEQQIINQHASFHPGGSHQRLLAPTKHRDNKLVSSIVSSDASSSSSSTSTSSLSSFKDGLSLYNLFFGSDSSGSGSSQTSSSPTSDYKSSSGISSRSSIVKAISDNKLARTISEVGKSMSGNKYVASAAAASALAALGLAVTKLFTGSYLFSSGYSNAKLGDPMLTSASYMSPSGYLAAATNDRNYNIDQAATSGANNWWQQQQPSNGYQQYGPQFSMASDYSDALSPYSFNDPIPSASYPMAAQSSVIRQAFLAKPTDYKTSSPLGETGHYSEFYANQGASNVAEPETSDSSVYAPTSGSSFSYRIPPGYYRYVPKQVATGQSLSGQSDAAAAASQWTFGSSGNGNEQSSATSEQQVVGPQQTASPSASQYQDQMMSSSSLDNQMTANRVIMMPQYSSLAAKSQRAPYTSMQMTAGGDQNSGRRSGTMATKLDEVSKAIAQQRLMDNKNNMRQIYVITPSDNYNHRNQHQVAVMRQTDMAPTLASESSNRFGISNGNYHASMALPSNQQQGQQQQTLLRPDYHYLRPTGGQLDEITSVSPTPMIRHRQTEKVANGNGGWRSIESSDGPAASEPTSVKSHLQQAQQQQQQQQWSHMSSLEGPNQKQTGGPSSVINNDNNDSNNDKQSLTPTASSSSSSATEELQSHLSPIATSNEDQVDGGETVAAAAGGQSSSSSAAAQATSGQQHLHRVSRTPPSSTGQQQQHHHHHHHRHSEATGVKRQAAASGSIDNLTDYDSDTLTGSASGLVSAHSAGLSAPPTNAKTMPTIRNANQQFQPVVSSASASSSSQSQSSSPLMRHSESDFGPQIAFVESTSGHNSEAGGRETHNGDAGPAKNGQNFQLISMTNSVSSSQVAASSGGSDNATAAAAAAKIANSRTKQQ